MAQWIWAVIAVIGILLIAATVLIINRQRRTVLLQRRFGPEYARTVEAADDRHAAEAALQERARRRSKLDIVPLTEPGRLRYAEEWRGLQEHFVDRPSEAVDAAESLLTRVMEERGYPLGEFEQQADLLSVDHPHVVENYRLAHEIHRRNQAQQATTEDLREAMLRYRSLFDDLLHPGQHPGQHTVGQHTVDQHTVDQHTVSRDTVSQDTVSRDTGDRAVTERDVGDRSAAGEDTRRPVADTGDDDRRITDLRRDHR